MKLRFRVLIAMTVFSGLFLQACSRHLEPQESCNFVQNSAQRRVAWQKGHLPVKLYIHKSVPPEAYAAIDEAIAQYNGVLGEDTFSIVARGVDGDLDPTKDGYSMIYWFDTWDPTRQTEQARTTIHWVGGEIFEADMRINGANFSYYFGSDNDPGDKVDFTSLIVHELGHVLGLKHNPVQGSVMNANLDEGVNRRKLGEVDVTDLRCQY